MNEPKAPRRRDSVISELSQVLPRLPKYARLVWLLLKDPTLSAKQRTALMAAVGYSISPIDAIPGIIPVIGQLDDLAVVLFTVRWVLGTMPVEKAAEYLSSAGLTAEIIEDYLQLAKRSGIRILKRLIAIMGVTAIWVWVEPSLRHFVQSQRSFRKNRIVLMLSQFPHTVMLSGARLRWSR